MAARFLQAHILILHPASSKAEGLGVLDRAQVVNCTVLVPLSPAYWIRFALCLAGRLGYAWL